ncbi:tail assembly protein [Pseudomonas mediterranea]|uniref:Phage-related protein, tail component n=2 Tax=Pseudomonas fluorescens group TaxID=136843 RepID=A0AAX2DEB1_9PSED|nr:tail assembly protein [Pseudomonas mediterranea]KGU87188.1 phage tail assembly protein [Pseudomonas mediterranea CFBP 5447]SDU61384.1 Phage-related protein, tail component [Pseudomonas mediterranea]
MSRKAEKMQTVMVYGPLAKITGKRKHVMTTSSGWADIMGYFRSQYPGFEKFMMESRDKGLCFAVFNGKKNIGEDDLQKPTGNKVISISPVIVGSKRAGGLQTIIGTVMIAAAYVLSFTPFAAASPFLYAAGTSMAIGGVVQMLSPQAKGLGTQDSPNNRPSYSFNGAVNTSVQGGCVPLLYGRMIVGSAVVSAGIYSEDQM